MKTILVLPFLLVFTKGISQPQQEVKKQVDSLVIFIKNKATESFAAHTVYRGSDTKRKWKDVYNPSHPEELKAAKQVMEELQKALAGCNYQEFDTFKQKQEIEGTWFVYTYACGSSKKIHLAFLKIKGRYALGDIDVKDDNDDD